MNVATENRNERMKWKATNKFMEFISKTAMPVTVTVIAIEPFEQIKFN